MLIDCKMVFFSITAYKNPKAPYLQLRIDPLINNYPESTYMRIWVNSLIIQNDFDTITHENDRFTWDGVSYFLPHGQPTIHVKYLNDVGITCEYSSKNDLIQWNIAGTLGFASPSAVILGFSEDTTYTIAPNDLSPNSMFLDAHDVLYLRSSLLSKKYEIKDGETTTSSIITAIPNVAQRSDDLGIYSIIKRNRRFLNDMTFVLTDTLGDALSVNSPWHASVLIKCHQDVETNVS